MTWSPTISKLVVWISNRFSLGVGIKKTRCISFYISFVQSCKILKKTTIDTHAHDLQVQEYVSL